MLIVALWVFVGLVALGAVAAGVYILRNLKYFAWDMRGVESAGFTEKQISLDGRKLNYAEGPDNGPALLLIHGQGTDWKNYARVLPTLANNFHIFAVDVYGHGGSARTPDHYSTVKLGASLRAFLQEVVRQPALVSGHSSGGQIAAWLAAHAPELVSGVVLEDPPLFTTELPRAEKTWNYVDLATACHTFLESDGQDFVSYYLRHARIWTFFGDGAAWFQGQGLAYQARNPGKPPQFWALPPSMNELFRTLVDYDPRFGDTFYTGLWNAGFDQAATLANLSVPAVLIHTNWQYDGNGILMAAMDDKDTQRARSLIKGVLFFKVASGHGFHFEKPQQFIRILQDFGAHVADE